MRDGNALPEHLEPIGERERFSFLCHPAIACFGECCRRLRLMLTPYDVVRLREGLKLPSREFIERFTIMEFRPPSYVPVLFLKMEEGGDQTCPFLSKEGCSVYSHRPSACRIYPVARATRYHSVHGVLMESFFLVKEPHCRGFEESREWNIFEWFSDQGLEKYHRLNDEWTRIVMSPKLKGGLTAHQQELFYMATYELGMFRKLVSSPKFRNAFGINDGIGEEDDERLLDFGLKWLAFSLLGETETLQQGKGGP
ncbi:MAG: YkgJ family cysteine cluster protein [Syntrophobacterales bacterium]|nr:YkgJ family cysteine cluster protein [Syntrophobacterales bacterium]